MVARGVSEESVALAKAARAAGQTLSNGEVMPAIGFGTWDIPDETACAQAVCRAIQAGYRMIDGAAFYGNEVGVGRGLRAAGVPRSELFVTSKVWTTQMGYQKTMDAFFKSLNDLNIDYLDLYLIHWPASPKKNAQWREINAATWKAMTELYDEGYVRAIGVSNFKPVHLEPLLECKTIPMVNQIEIHPGFSQRELVSYCQSKGIVVEGWSPFGRGAVLDNAVINQIADQHDCTAAQVCLAFSRQLGVIPLPKSVNPNRMLSNIDFLDITLSDQEMSMLLSLDDIKLGYSQEDPDQ